jgi:protease I
VGAVLRSMPVAFLAAADGVEHSELTRPWERVAAEAGKPVLVAPGSGKIQTFDHLDPAGQMAVDVPLAGAREAGFAALVLPSGAASSSQVRTDPAVTAFVRSFFDARKPVAAICRAPRIIAEADRVRGRTLTSWPGLRAGIENAGGTWADEEAVVCTRAPGVLITSRQPADLAAFCDAMVNAFAVLGRRR